MTPEQIREKAREYRKKLQYRVDDDTITPALTEVDLVAFAESLLSGAAPSAASGGQPAQHVCDSHCFHYCAASGSGTPATPDIDDLTCKNCGEDIVWVHENDYERQVSARDVLARKIAASLFVQGFHRDCESNDHRENAQTLDYPDVETLAALISPLLPEGAPDHLPDSAQFWEQKYSALCEKLRDCAHRHKLDVGKDDDVDDLVISALDSDSDEWDECHVALTAAGIPETDKSPMGEDCLLSLESRIRKLAAKAEGDGWIPCAERMPNFNERQRNDRWFAVANYGRQDVAKLLKGKHFMGHALQFGDVLFWRELHALPSPPAEGPAKEQS